MTTATETNLRIFMRNCQQYWLRQYINKPQKDGSLKPTQVSIEQSYIGVFADMKTVIDKPNVHFAHPKGDLITEADCERVFNTEFSDAWQDVKARYIPGKILPYDFIPGYNPDKH